MAAWQQEFKTRLVEVLSADAGLTGLLASDEAIYQQRPDQGAALPCVVYALDSEYAAGLNKPGKHVARLKVSALADDPDALDAIEDALRALLDGNPGPLESASWRCAKCRLVRAGREPDPFFDPDSHQPLTAMTSEWEVWLYAK